MYTEIVAGNILFCYKDIYENTKNSFGKFKALWRIAYHLIWYHEPFCLPKLGAILDFEPLDDD